MTPESLHNIHKGEEVWMFSKGPSLDSFDMSGAGKFRVTINEAIDRVASALYAFSWRDDNRALNIPEGCIHIDGFDWEYTSKIEGHNPMKLPLFFRTGTVELAMSFLIWMGFKTVHMIGVDGKGKYAEGFDWIRKDEDQAEIDRKRRGIKERISQLANTANIKIKDYS
jgi:hypothetical protein